MKTNSTKTNITKTVDTGITITAIKWIGLIAMLVDHAAVVMMNRILPTNEAPYILMRVVGRLAFPLFCFSVVEGFIHTRNFWKYLLRVGIFSILSEVPFDILTRRSYFDITYNNTLWNFVLLLLVLYALREIQRRWGFLEPKGVLGGVGAIAAGCAVSYFAKIDHSYVGILLGVSMYLLRQKRLWMLIVSALCLLLTSMSALMQGSIQSAWIEAAAIVALPILWFYHGRKSLIENEFPRFFFYILYPLHLLILGLWGVLIQAKV